MSTQDLEKFLVFSDMAGTKMGIQTPQSLFFINQLALRYHTCPDQEILPWSGVLAKGEVGHSLRRAPSLEGLEVHNSVIQPLPDLP